MAEPTSSAPQDAAKPARRAARHGKKRSGGATETAVIAGREHEVPKITTKSGNDLKPVYRPEDLNDFSYETDLGDPGEFPFTRGVHPTMYRTHLWTFRQYAGYGSGEDARQRFEELIDSGQQGLSVAFDLPTQLGLDSDNPRARLEVGRVGVAVDSIADFLDLFETIDMSKISTSFTINATASIIYALYIAAAEEQGVARHELRGTIQNDPLKEFVARGNYIFPPGPSVKLAADAIEFAAKETPKFNAISVSSSHIKEAGATNAFATAATLRNAMAYIDAVIERGYTIDDFGPNISFNFYGDMEFFENICQQRAARRLWARTMRDRYQATSEGAMKLRYVAGAGSGTSLTRQYPHLNIARIAYHCLMQVLGGTQACAIPSFDEAYDIPSAEAARISLLIQGVVAYETGVTNVVDPLGGSYYVESLTNELEAKFLKVFEQIDAWGGPIEAIENGTLQLEIAEQSYEWQKRVESGEDAVIGVNMFEPTSDENDEEIRTFHYDQSVRERQAARLTGMKARRDQDLVGAALQRLDRVVASGDNVMPALIECAKSFCTVQEMTDVLVEHYGRFDAPPL